MSEIATSIFNKIYGATYRIEEKRPNCIGRKGGDVLVKI